MELPITGAENDPVIRTSSSFRQTDRNSVLRIQPSDRSFIRSSFDVVVMKETLLLAELETQGFSVDLRALTKVILSDVGATLHVLRIAGQTCGEDDSRPIRVEDCIADLGVEACIHAMSGHLMERDLRSQGIAELWSHSREIAEHCRNLAEPMVGIDPDEAYLVGLYHSIGSLPGVLGVGDETYEEFGSVWTGLELAREWSLPGCVVDYFSETETRSAASAWLGIVGQAHRCAGTPAGDCARRGAPHPQLLWAV